MVKTTINGEEIPKEILNDLRCKSRDELLKIFKEEVLRSERLKQPEQEQLAEKFGLLFGLMMKKTELKAQGRLDEVKGVERQIRKLRKGIKEYEEILRLENLRRRYGEKYEKVVEEGFGTTQKVDNEFLIRAIADVRARKARLKDEGKTAREISIADIKVRKTRPQLSIKRGSSLRPRPYKVPYDWAGYKVDKYPPSIGLDLDKVRCSNCRHWDEKEKFCLIFNRRTSKDSKCAEFGRRGL